MTAQRPPTTVRMEDLTAEQGRLVRALIEAKVTAERAAQGLPPKVTDPVALDRIARVFARR